MPRAGRTEERQSSSGGRSAGSHPGLRPAAAGDEGPSRRPAVGPPAPLPQVRVRSPAAPHSLLAPPRSNAAFWNPAALGRPPRLRQAGNFLPAARQIVGREALTSARVARTTSLACGR